MTESKSVLDFTTLGQFIKHPMAYVMFVAIGAIGYLYVDNKAVYAEAIETHKIEKITLQQRIVVLEKKVEHLYMMLSGIQAAEEEDNK